MKSYFLPSFFAALLLTAGSVNAAPCETGNCIANQQGFTGVRQYGGIGTKNWDKMVFNKTTKGWFRTEWNKVMATVVRDHSCALEDHHPTLMARVHWSEAYIDSSIKPSAAQAKDPNWSNYVWNHPENGKGFVYDGISDALNDQLIDNGNGIAKLAVQVGLSATTGNLIPPIWMRNDKSLAWVEGTNQNNKSDNWHVRFDNPKAVDHAADFLEAFLAKFGNNKGIHSIVLGEYYFGQQQYIPSGLSRGDYILGVKDLWEQIVSSAPRDADGNRVNIVQTNPLFDSQVTVDDMERIGLGISESDTRVILPVTNSKHTLELNKLYDNEKVHVMIEGDARYACQDRRQRWDGTANPFGHKNGYSGVATPQEIFWYHSEEGPAPTHSIFMTIANWCQGAPQTTANFIDAVRKFGRCGSESEKWGASPAALPKSMSADSIATAQPKSPLGVAIQ